jgi:hypothetical protein
MPRIGKLVNIENPLYALDRNRGSLRIPSHNGKGEIWIHSLKFRNKDAYDNHIFEIQIGEEKIRIHKDELLAGLQYV